MPLIDCLNYKTVNSIANNFWLAISSQIYTNFICNSDSKVVTVHFTVKLFLVSMINIILWALNNKKRMGRIPFSIFIVHKGRGDT